MQKPDAPLLYPFLVWNPAIPPLVSQIPVCVCVLNRFGHVRLFAALWTVACQAPLSVGFSRQEYWSGWPFPSPGNLPDPGVKLGSPALQADSAPTLYPLSYEGSPVGSIRRHRFQRC